MVNIQRFARLLLSAAVGVLGACASHPAGPDIGFFVTSAGPGRGADLGGLEGADRHCQALAQAAGAGHRKWRAYLSVQASGGTAASDARDRIGRGPWRNSKGVLVANNLAELHGANHLDATSALDERGEHVIGYGDVPNTHDILTGSTPDGRAVSSAADTTCGNWTSSNQGAAMVGHHDRRGLDESDAARSWNSSHLSRGCSARDLGLTGGSGRFYCFASD